MIKYQAYTLYNYHRIQQFNKISDKDKYEIELVGKVLPFRTSNYVVDELIDWDNFRTDPLYILNFPNKEMLSQKHYSDLETLINKGADPVYIKGMVARIHDELNPHPAGQLDHNIPKLNGKHLVGIQHKYRETLLFFPSHGQSCHAFCTFCFRWPQFTGQLAFKFAMKQVDLLVTYIKENPQISDILYTGGDPMVMSAKNLEYYINPILENNLPQIHSIRIGSKSLSYWPYRFLTDPDSDDILRLFSKIVKKGVNLAFMAHFSHPRELETSAVQKAIKRIQETGAIIRAQSPIMKHINDNEQIWVDIWRKQVDLGIIPYYMFVARNTGPQNYFAIPLGECWEIYRKAFSKVSGICRTVRGPSMSADPGKVQILGVSEVNGEKVFVLTFLQGRNPEWTGIPFFAKYDEKAVWLNDLKPAFSQDAFFFQKLFSEFVKLKDKDLANDNASELLHW